MEMNVPQLIMILQCYLCIKNVKDDEDKNDMIPQKVKCSLFLCISFLKHDFFYLRINN